MFDRIMEDSGGANNAYTSEDLTVYTHWFPLAAMETIFDLEADRIANLDMNTKMVESERGVVASERTTGLKNSNFRTLHQPKPANKRLLGWLIYLTCRSASIYGASLISPNV